MHYFYYRCSPNTTISCVTDIWQFHYIVASRKPAKKQCSIQEHFQNDLQRIIMCLENFHLYQNGPTC